jgi:hypothetical protein
LSAGKKVRRIFTSGSTFRPITDQTYPDPQHLDIASTAIPLRKLDFLEYDFSAPVNTLRQNGQFPFFRFESHDSFKSSLFTYRMHPARFQIQASAYTRQPQNNSHIDVADLSTWVASVDPADPTKLCTMHAFLSSLNLRLESNFSFDLALTLSLSTHSQHG